MCSVNGEEASDVTSKSQVSSSLALQLPPNSGLWILARHSKLVVVG